MNYSLQLEEKGRRINTTNKNLPKMRNQSMIVAMPSVIVISFLITGYRLPVLHELYDQDAPGHIAT